MTQLSYLTPNVIPVADRRTRLLVMGILLILAGGLCALIFGFTAYFALVIMRRYPGPAMPQQNLLMPLMLYAAAAAVFLSTGVGAMMRRRWSRPVILAIAWPWLVVGIFGIIIAALTMAQMQMQFSGSAMGNVGMSPFMLIGLFVAAGIYVFFPLSLILVLQPQDVQATLDFYDPNPRWTDGRPVPVLCLCAYLLLTTVTLVLNARGAFPLFGIVLTGAAGVAAICVVAASFLVAMFLSIRLMFEGWLLALAMFILTPISSIVTLMRIGPMELYRAMGLTNEELAMAQRMNYANRGSLTVWAVIGAAIGIGFALASRRAFFARAHLAGGFNVVPAPPLDASVQIPQAPPPENV